MVKSVNTNKVEMDKKVAIAVVFENPEFGKIRTLTDENGEPLFCAKDVCDVLGYKKSYNAVYQLVNSHDTLKQGVKVSGSLRKDGSRTVRTQQMLFVNESGFYALVPGSKLSTAVKFKNWVRLMCCHRFARRAVISRCSRERVMRRQSDMQKKFFVLRSRRRRIC